MAAGDQAKAKWRKLLQRMKRAAKRQEKESRERREGPKRKAG